MSANTTITTDAVQQILSTVFDPEVPVLSVLDLGIIRNIIIDNSEITITVTPTYSGCPAMDVIRMNIRFAMIEAGYNNLNIVTSLSPAWTTDWMSEAGKNKLKAFGIAPPNATQSVCSIEAFQQDEAVQCPRCYSMHTTLVSRFASTACKALYKCEDCKEPFDYFKCH